MLSVLNRNNIRMEIVYLHSEINYFIKSFGKHPLNTLDTGFLCLLFRYGDCICVVKQTSFRTRQKATKPILRNTFSILPKSSAIYFHNAGWK